MSWPTTSATADPCPESTTKEETKHEDRHEGPRSRVHVGGEGTGILRAEAHVFIEVETAPALQQALLLARLITDDPALPGVVEVVPGQPQLVDQRYFTKAQR